MVSSIVLSSINEFIDYALFFTTILAIYYFIMLLGGGKETEEQKTERLATQKYIDDKISGNKKKKEKEADKKKNLIAEKKAQAVREKAQSVREKLLNGTKGFIINAEQAAEKLQHDSFDKLTEGERLIAQGFVGEILENLKDAKRVLRVEKGKERGEKREYINKLYEYVEYMLRDLYKKGLKKNFPEQNDPHLDIKVKKLKEIAAKIKISCGHVITSIDHFIQNNKHHLEEEKHHLAEEGLRRKAEHEVEENLDEEVRDSSDKKKKKKKGQKARIKPKDNKGRGYPRS